MLLHFWVCSAQKRLNIQELKIPKFSRMKKIAFFITFSVLSFSLMAQTAAKSDPKETSQKFAATLFYIDNFYVDSTNTPELVEEAIVSMLKELDPHSSYISKDDIDAANEPLEGSFEGIGVTFQLLRDTILVVSPVPGGPSEKLGILGGDRILKIDGEEAFGKKVTNKFVMDRLRGKKGTKVEVSIFRENQTGLIDYTIVRDEIPINSIDASYMLSKDIGYIKLNRFSKTSMEEFHSAMKALRKSGMENLILDLRSNSGGFLNVAVELSDEFLEEGKLIVYTEGSKSPRQDFTATKRGSFEKGKLVVLINEGSASASEIVSGAIQDWDRGIVIGRRSFGKGLVQRPFQLPDGSVIRLTAARYYTPSGRSIQRPYDKGSETYFKDLFERQEKGELVNADSIHFPDSLRYLTAANRTVFGGGGIMPDIFVPVDTLHLTRYYSDLIRKGVFNRYTIDFSNKNRDEYKKAYKTIEKYIQVVEVTQEMMDDFLALAKKEEVSFDEELFKRSEDFIKLQIKALIARNIWDMESYYKVVSDQDETLQQAIEIINKKDIFSQVIHPKE